MQKSTHVTRSCAIEVAIWIVALKSLDHVLINSIMLYASRQVATPAASPDTVNPCDTEVTDWDKYEANYLSCIVPGRDNRLPDGYGVDASRCPHGSTKKGD